MSETSLRRETFVVDDRPAYPYRVLGNRYTPSTTALSTERSKAHEQRVSLIFLHAVGMFKECFEPVIENLFKDHSTLQTPSGKIVVVDEAWSLECPCHGQSAVMNASDIAKNHSGAWSYKEYAASTHTFLRGRPGGHDLLQRKLVLVGHSLGACIIPYLLQMEPKFDVHCIISAEPLRGPVSKRMDKGSKVFSDMALCRQDVWLSRSQARTYFESHPFTKSWHPTVRKLFLEFALADHPASKLAEPYPFKGVMLACSRENEAAIYRSLAQDNAGYYLMTALYAGGVPLHYMYDKNPPAL
ncbi:hypothetical protein SISSUDRAFT_1133380 [Sistotremastrum suecicum HHB10207 ss-3]|uniref:Uncharacterized protein n=1 Tax=Sistotremastrum suecicum HHB10207 ss-3 TaxID=1314776 RepID=A0A165XD90_9AGAM|nr:hypothetical protein SISSUDRAFT_1133380 [Sistotremastrum suecicum HHB10207 ss-3]